MNREMKSCLIAAVFTTALFLLPMVALLVGWIGWDFKTGGLAALVTFITLASVAAGAMVLIRNPSVFTASLPLLIGVSYALLPDFILGTIDDGVAFGFGSLLSFLLWRKRRPNFPAWVLIPLLACSVYTAIGGFILPFLGPLDELFVYVLAIFLSWGYYERRRRPGVGQVSYSAAGHAVIDHVPRPDSAPAPSAAGGARVFVQGPALDDPSAGDADPRSTPASDQVLP